jgi:hypothetical protein
VGGADGYPEPGGDLREGVVPAKVKVDEAEERPLMRRKLATAVTLTGDDEHMSMVAHSTRACGGSSTEGSKTNEAPELMS